MNGFRNNGNSIRRSNFTGRTTETLHIKIEPGIEMPRTYRNSRHVLQNSPPKILNFSMGLDSAKRNKVSQIKQEPELIVNDVSDTFSQIQPTDSATTVHRVSKQNMLVITPSDRFEIKFPEETDDDDEAAAALAVPDHVPTVDRNLYKCKMCVAQFVRSYQLKRHTFVVHKVDQNSAPNRNLANTLVCRIKPLPERIVTVKSPVVIQGNPQVRKPVFTTIFKSPIFTNGSIPFRTINLNRDTFSDRPSRAFPPLPTHKPGVAIGNGNSSSLPSVRKPGVFYPRIIVRKETGLVKFNESTKDEFSQIVYEVSPHGATILFKCAACDRSFKNLVVLDSHLQCHNGQAFRYKCELCDEFVASVAQLRSHVHSHTCSQRLPVKCERCEKRFRDQAQADHHECVSQPSEICHLCRQTFLSDSLLRSHQFFHTRVKPYKCDACDSHFIHLSALCKHKEVESSCGIIDDSLIIGQ